MNIKAAEKLSGVSRRNIRFYEQKGLLKPERNRENDYREYTDADVKALKLIRALRMLDMPLEQIRDVVQGDVSLQSAVLLHKGQLKIRQKEIETAIRFCDELSGGEKPDIDAVLDRMDAPENQSKLPNRGDRDYADAVIGIAAPLLAGLIPCGAGAVFGLIAVVCFSEAPAIGYVCSTVAYALWGFFGYWVQKQGHWIKNAALIHAVPAAACLSYLWMLRSGWPSGLLELMALYGYFPILFTGLPYMILFGTTEQMTWIPMVMLLGAFCVGGIVGWLRSRWKRLPEKASA